MAFCCLNATAQKRAKYEFMRNLPVYADSLIAHFDYPLAWENSGIKKFGKWKKIARQKVFLQEASVVHFNLPIPERSFAYRRTTVWV